MRWVGSEVGGKWVRVRRAAHLLVLPCLEQVLACLLRLAHLRRAVRAADASRGGKKDSQRHYHQPTCVATTDLACRNAPLLAVARSTHCAAGACRSTGPGRASLQGLQVSS